MGTISETCISARIIFNFFLALVQVLDYLLSTMPVLPNVPNLKQSAISLDNQRAIGGFTRQEWLEASDVSESTFYRLMNGETENPTQIVVDRLSAGLKKLKGITMSEPSNLPPGVTGSDIERNANGECPMCGRILNDEGECPVHWEVEVE